MEDSYIPQHVAAAQGVSSFMLESLLWNVDNQWYLDNCTQYRKVYSFKLLIKHLLVCKSLFKTYKEANGIKPLCENHLAYQKLCDFVDALSMFYDYE